MTRDQASKAAKVHDLKTLPPFFDHVASERKPFEVRRDDRRFEVGDLLRLREWNVNDGGYTGREVVRRVTYILRRSGVSPFTGLEVGHVVMAIEPAVLP